MTSPFKVLVANRGEIACRLIRSCTSSGVHSVSIYTESDATSLHASLAHENILLPRDKAAGYLDAAEILAICARLRVDAVIPGYGFLSEDAGFAKSVCDAGMVWVGPSAECMAQMGQKHRARELAVAAAVPVVAGTELLSAEADAVAAAERLGFPIMLKATGGGGGMGLQVCQTVEEISAAFKKVQSRGEALFNNAGVFLERFYPESRHVEVQVFGNGTDVVHFGERECSIQRRHQKVIEECPSPFVQQRPGMREKLVACAIAYASKLRYKSAGTVEFLVDDTTGAFFFLEMNTRLQVEHGITELCYGVDLVALMLRQAECEKAGEGGLPSASLLALQRDAPCGAAIEARVYAEVPYRNYAPSPGLLQAVEWPSDQGVRIDTWVQAGQRIAPFYDPLIAKVMVYAGDREAAAEKMQAVLDKTKLQGPATNQHFLKDVVASASFARGDTLTNFLDVKFAYQPCAIDVLSPGAFTTVQDYPARAMSGHGIPKAGPMDNISFRIANILVGNPPGMEGLEMTLSGPELLFTAPAVFSVCGAPMPVSVDGEEKPMWSRLALRAGQKLRIGKAESGGCRAYLAVKGGFPEIPYYLGSKGGTPSLAFGGTQGRQLQMGDWIELHPDTRKWASEVGNAYTLPASCIPDYDIREVYCMHGPHDTDDLMTPDDKKRLYSTTWKIGHNSNRTGVRLVGFVPEWARKDGGEGGSHPSNLLDFGYPSPGGVNWGGDSPVIFSMDSPDLGGLLCSSTVVSADLWRLGQVRPGGTLKLTPTRFEHAVELARRNEAFVEELQALVAGDSDKQPKLDLVLPDAGLELGKSDAILRTVAGGGDRRPKVTYRQGGDCFLLVEIGTQTIDIMVTCRVKLLVQKIEELKIPKLVMNPNVGSVVIQFDAKVITQQALLETVHELEASIETATDTTLKCREIHLPLVFDHPALTDSITRYMETSRPTATYLPDNVEYLRQNNELSSRREVFEKALDIPFLVVAVGFLVGTPIAFPLEPLSVIAAQKYNPTRLSTPGGTLGMGGNLFATYPVEAPGGYMLFARTMECWDTYGLKPDFIPQRPWFFEPFDILRYHEVSIGEYDMLAKDYRSGKYHFDIRESVFSLQEVYDRFQGAKKDAAVLQFREGQKRGMAERQAVEKQLFAEWKEGQAVEERREAERLASVMGSQEAKITVDSPMDANVWKVLVQPGEVLRKQQVVAILEAMKMEINVLCAGEAVGATVETIASKPGSIVRPGSWIVVAKSEK